MSMGSDIMLVVGEEAWGVLLWGAKVVVVMVVVSRK